MHHLAYEQGPLFEMGAPQIWPQLPALLFARCCISRRLQSEHLSRDALRDQGWEFSAVGMKEHDA
jgi:hypothetical protein